MNKRRNYIAWTMMVALLFSNTALAAENKNSESAESMAVRQKIELIKEQEQKILSSEEVVKNSEANEVYQTLVGNIGDNECASFYGGSYINENNELVVIVTEQSEENVQMLMDAAESGNILIEQGTVTLEYLKNIQKKYSEKLQCLINDDNLSNDKQQLLDSIVGISLVQNTSEVVIDMYQLNDKKIKEFRNIFGEDKNVRFENADRISLALSWYTGKQLYVSGKGYLTTGYRAYYINGAGVRKNGFVTAGHGCSVGNTVYGVTNNGNVVLGTCLLSMFTGSVDAAFVAITNDNYQASNTVDSSIVSSTSILATTTATNSDLAEGTWVYSFGAITDMKSGTISSNSYSFIYEDTDTGHRYYFVDMVQMSNKVQKGDSGSCVSVVKNGGCAAAGTVFGIRTSLGVTLESYFSKISNQISAFGIVKY